ncbi:hypothetical protein ASPACDRAFT_39890 [Aspergillus aculeatus ATCC 16872]|uniref:Uncharacterized protein n=1 Tax=Aspergillus aculeatus (strain ATCC 16872 / CBS 172.66 / WB 5094) TaxID=690307 RepID=A0A1L9X2A1_ASPA1|nr:uncharacterized protein ASPACDRAFT_39890 [Aspergillus aculeatus ATCC 16872]OJK02583.1 hypothetical protein ASPACDRAFT_39890 [Aspergillus aculeatus ATCC 16872]
MAPPRRPRPNISLWRRFRWWLRHLESPLELRASFRRLKQHNKHPLLTLLRMFIPYPSWYFNVPGPFSLGALIEDDQNGTGIIQHLFEDLHNLRAIPIWRMRDTPLRSIYRLYALFLADKYTLMGYETEYFFYRSGWKLQHIPDPKDADPLRYAVIACIVEELHQAINWRLSLGLRRSGEHVYRETDEHSWPPYVAEELPEWTRKVAPIDKDLLRRSVPPEKLDTDGNLVLEENGLSPILPGPKHASRSCLTGLPDVSTPLRVVLPDIM